jgi:hypothetical protein
MPEQNHPAPPRTTTTRTESSNAICSAAVQIACAIAASTRWRGSVTVATSRAMARRGTERDALARRGMAHPPPSSARSSFFNTLPI